MNPKLKELLDSIAMLDTSTKWRVSMDTLREDEHRSAVNIFAPVNEMLQERIQKFYGKQVAVACGKVGQEMTLLLASCFEDGSGVAVIHICFRKREGATIRK